MVEKHSIARVFEISVCAAAALVLSAGAGLAAPKKSKEKDSCSEAWKAGDALIKEGQLRKAREWMHKCSAASCSAVISRECTARSTRLGIDIPTIVPSIEEDQDNLHDVEVSMDGEVVTSRINGHAVEVDPGPHEFAFKSENGAVVRRSLVIQQGQRNRPVIVSFVGVAPEPLAKAAGPAPAERTLTSASATVPPGPSAVVARRVRRQAQAPRQERSWVPSLSSAILAGSGAVALTSGLLLDQWARRDDALLVRDCAPNCKPESVNHIRRLTLASRISLGAGIAALGVGAYLYARDVWFGGGEVVARGPSLSPSSSYAFGVVPTASGGWAALSRSF